MIKKFFGNILLALLTALLAVFIGCTAKSMSLDPTPYSQDDFGTTSAGGISVATERKTYGTGTSEISYTVVNSSADQVYYGVSYSIEKKEQGQWYQMPFRDDTAWIAIAYQLDAGQSQTYTADLSLLKNSLSAGEYRLIKQIGEKVYAAEFTLS